MPRKAGGKLKKAAPSRREGAAPADDRSPAQGGPGGQGPAPAQYPFVQAIRLAKRLPVRVSGVQAFVSPMTWPLTPEGRAGGVVSRPVPEPEPSGPM